MLPHLFEMLQSVYQSCSSGQASAAQHCPVLMQSCAPAQVQKLQSCISKRFQRGLLAWAERHTSRLLRWSCALLSKACLHLPAPPASSKVPSPCISFSSALNTKRVPFYHSYFTPAHLHCFCNTGWKKSLFFPPEEDILLRCVAEHTLGVLYSLLQSDGERGRQRKKCPSDLVNTKIHGCDFKKMLIVFSKGNE